MGEAGQARRFDEVRKGRERVSRRVRAPDRRAAQRHPRNVPPAGKGAVMTATHLRTPELRIGAEAPPDTYPPLTRTDFVKYQGASGDFHPLHHDEQYAHES